MRVRTGLRTGVYAPRDGKRRDWERGEDRLTQAPRELEPGPPQPEEEIPPEVQELLAS